MTSKQPSNARGAETMTLLDILAVANKAYPDDMVAAHYDPETGDTIEGQGDTVAEFVAREIRETFSERHMQSKVEGDAFVRFLAAAQYIQRAATELQDVADALFAAAAGLNTCCLSTVSAYLEATATTQAAAHEGA